MHAAVESLDALLGQDLDDDCRCQVLIRSRHRCDALAHWQVRAVYRCRNLLAFTCDDHVDPDPCLGCRFCGADFEIVWRRSLEGR